MRLDQIFAENEDDEREHWAAHDKTGFFGAQGAGCLFFAKKTRRFLIAHRSKHVEQPGTWGTWGGAIDRGENPEEAVRREVQEEAGYDGPLIIKPMYVFVSGTFRYSNFLVIVPNEFTPILNWESQGYEWTDFGDWPQPLHFGLIKLFRDPVSMDLMRRLSRPRRTTTASAARTPK